MTPLSAAIVSRVVGKSTGVKRARLTGCHGTLSSRPSTPPLFASRSTSSSASLPSFVGISSAGVNCFLSPVSPSRSLSSSEAFQLATRVGIDVLKIEIWFQQLFVEGDVYACSRAVPTLLNATLNSLEAIFGLVRLAPSKKKVVKILKDLSGIVKPSRN